ncbi:selenocysteine-specific translation elongation factor [Thermovenabulum gondwanense]|uniref:Selenocysteine-specific elongation factor n=1 Tax=Thermovenabulum gondwanense TaxID=520767 RepID=A0A161PTB5_9FIRM|nr:selenocysteine-specific translation elongation factor [Thermovenabulum gondwanense]KYO64743.1 Selenocysteine-specific elongation factor [Thermovenabulum gondwanense]
MGNIIIGTAGHIDHGKTTLIKALTGIDTDRLKEEKERGITIDLGFAHFTLPNGKKVGIVDVPGHEKFVKNMLAGVGGIDLVLLVIAADEGIMPQTKEHLNILELLNTKKGIIVITKKDLVDNEWLEMVVEEVKETVKTSFLKDSPIIPVSSKTGEGLDLLVQKIQEMTQQEFEKDLYSPFRLPVDRVFTIPGIGTIVTGSLICGCVSVGDAVEIYPKKIKSKVRSIEVHGESREKAFAGQRTAINLVDVKPDDIKRGDVISIPGSMQPVEKAVINVKLLEDAEKSLKNRERVRFHAGTGEYLGRISIINREEILPGERAFAVIHFEEAVPVTYEDYFVIRRYSPVHTIGGGKVIFVNPAKIKKEKIDIAVKGLEKIANGGIKEFILVYLSLFGKPVTSIADLFPYLGKNYETIRSAVDSLVKDNSVVFLKSGNEEILCDMDYYDNLTEKAKEIVEAYHLKNPFSEGILKEELKSRLGLESKVFELFLSKWVQEGYFEGSGKYLKRKGYKIVLNEKEEQMKDKLLKIYEEKGWTPPAVEEVVQLLKDFEEEKIKSILNYLVLEGSLIKLNDEIYMHKTWVEKAKELLKNHFQKNKEISVSQFRDMLNTSRKYALPILEYFDGIYFTRRIKDVRIPGSRISD